MLHATISVSILKVLNSEIGTRPTSSGSGERIQNAGSFFSVPLPGTGPSGKQRAPAGGDGERNQTPGAG